MKKTLALILVATILATALAGCGSRKGEELASRVEHFTQVAFDNGCAMFNLCYIESKCLRDDGIGDEEMGEDYFNKCVARYNEQLEEWKREGDDVSEGYLDIMTERATWVQEEYRKIMELDLTDEMKSAAQHAFEANQRLLILSTSIHGPADSFLDEAESAVSDLGKAQAEGKALRGE